MQVLALSMRNSFVGVSRRRILSKCSPAKTRQPIKLHLRSIITAKVHLAWSSAGVATLHKHYNDGPVNLLASYAIWDQFLTSKPGINISNLQVDSGAFSVFRSGKVIDIDKFIVVAKQNPQAEIFSLDEIGNWQKSQANTLKIWAAGVPAMPIYHAGEPRNYLDWCVENTPCGKIAIACTSKDRAGVVREQFKYIWDKYGGIKIHGLAMASPKMLAVGPFDSVDASSWATAPGRFGQFCGFTGKQLHLKSKMRKGVDSDLWCEVREHQKREKFSEFVFRHELERIRYPGYTIRK